ncbi:chromate transporter [Cytobacillus horneckiae]|uniref:Chromate transporter n=1 Tax=Cytobacillus horneckiae TaxID=549687 RepID=A0A2N0ZKZ1_9BACI|nr:chromate transporter [Cytobacillus horneckiae]MEC1156322.1 chromate transporter [Cytobacillus horneckiae]MED2938340.1 chromate transporter [Cytobacillus horneckiae]PKG30146.1 chromate transporter [Cytobacillus horneckiae]
MILIQLFKTFVIIGFVSFGGGYAIIPIIEAEAIKHEWITAQQFIDIIGISGMSPGPIATNSAILVGHSVSGIIGAVISALGISLPSFILVLIIAAFFQKINHYSITKSIFYGLRPIVTSLIIYAALKFAITNNMISLYFSWHSLSLFIVFSLSLLSLWKLRWHPFLVILLSGFVGITIYS